MEYFSAILMIIICVVLVILGIHAIFIPSVGLAVLSFVVAAGFGYFAQHDIRIILSK